ncbi:tetratricopeptide repeat protein [Bacillus gobiensis]|uniref:response regulator aspartate phosphatase n=1 Tax=Bacillus gobiensis TaxID=1441095 RepID=UPI003D1A9DE8
MKAIAYEEVAHMINQWYKLIKRHQVEDSISMRDKILQTLDKTEQNQNLLLYFNLLDSRHKMLLESFQLSEEILNKIQKNPEVKGTDDMLQYYFLFFSGQFEFSKKNYIEAINYYKLAEDKLLKIPDDIEKAEFHYHVAISYYHIDQHFFSMDHAEKALATFREHDDYSHRTINSEMILGANKLDLFRFEEANHHYEHALEIAKATNNHYTEGLAYRNLGIAYMRRNMLSLAEDCFRKGLQIEEYEPTLYGLRTIYNLTHVLYKTDRIDEARKWCEKGIARAEKAGEEEYLAKLSLVYSLYDQFHTDTITVSIDYLSAAGLWNDVSELTLEVGLYFKKAGDTENAAKYFLESIQARDQILKITEDLK